MSVRMIAHFRNMSYGRQTFHEILNEAQTGKSWFRKDTKYACSSTEENDQLKKAKEKRKYAIVE